MKRSVKKNFIAYAATLIATVLLLFGPPIEGMAQGFLSPKSINVYIPVRQKFLTNVSGVEDIFQYALQAQSPLAPMPGGGAGGEYLFSMEGNDSTELVIRANETGRYVYKLLQRVENRRDNYSYDQSIYWITVDIYQSTEGRLCANVIIQIDAGAKVLEAEFKNTYTQTQVLPTTPPGDGGSVQTGDNNTPVFYVALMVASLLGLAALWISVRNSKSEKQKGDAAHEK